MTCCDFTRHMILRTLELPGRYEMDASHLAQRQKSSRYTIDQTHRFVWWVEVHHSSCHEHCCHERLVCRRFLCDAQFVCKRPCAILISATAGLEKAAVHHDSLPDGKILLPQSQARLSDSGVGINAHGGVWFFQDLVAQPGRAGEIYRVCQKIGGAVAFLARTEGAPGRRRLHLNFMPSVYTPARIQAPYPKELRIWTEHRKMMIAWSSGARLSLIITRCLCKIPRFLPPEQRKAFRSAWLSLGCLGDNGTSLVQDFPKPCT